MKTNIIFRVNKDEKIKIENNSKKFGFHTVSEYIRFVVINVKEINIRIRNEKEK